MAPRAACVFRPDEYDPLIAHCRFGGWNSEPVRTAYALKDCPRVIAREAGQFDAALALQILYEAARPECRLARAC